MSNQSKTEVSDGTPPADWLVDVALVRQLLTTQHPDLADQPLRRMAHGFDNVMFRVGNDLAIRIPRRGVAVPGVRTEQTWLPRLAPLFPISIPALVRIGVPDETFPHPWSVVRWLSGQAADHVRPRTDQAIPLADTLRTLHGQSCDSAPMNALRSQPLAARSDAVCAWVADPPAGFGQAEVIALLRLWDEAVVVPRDTPCLIHGDLHPRNVLTSDAAPTAGAFVGIIDWGDLCRGDAALDLASAWMLFDDASARDMLFDHYGASRDLRQRAHGWALFMASVLLRADERHAAIGVETLRRLLGSRDRM